MSRSYWVKINLDDLCAELDTLRPDQHAEWLAGFRAGSRGKIPAGWDGPRMLGAEFGLACHGEAEAYRATKAAGGKARQVQVKQAYAQHMLYPCSADAQHDTQPTNNQQPTTNKEQPTTNSSSDKSDTSGFEAWWDAYGKKVGKKTAAKEWSKLTPEDRDAAMRSTPAYVAWKSDPQYRKDPERFLKHRHWEDQIPVHTPGDPKGDPNYDPFMDGAITDPDEVRRLLGYSNER